ncbi:MAG: UDP-N-acetylmuramate dehydrogenase [Pseudomonadota bacterium]|nr:UDP-N-acetylmuramate dehydrogenase [Pseudomonadota bacterium]
MISRAPILPKKITRSLRGRLLHNESLARYTSWRVGGPADYLFVPTDNEDLAVFFSILPADVPLLWMGLGSNLLVRDGGFRGAVICTHKGLAHAFVCGNSGYFAQAGVTCAKVARASVRAGRLGAEFMAGIPGTVGGALAMNAGAYGKETWDIVDKVELIDRQGQIHQCTKHAFDIGYRSVGGYNCRWFLSATLGLVPGSKDEGRRTIRSLLNTRGNDQPINDRSAGSVFKNPCGDFAARLIDVAGLKGRRCGGAQVSSRHANFIINTGQATALDIELLISQIKDAVARSSGIELVEEVRIVGE